MTTMTRNRNRNTGPRGALLEETSYADALQGRERLHAALTLLRVVVGTVFLVHGAQKLFVFGVGGVIGAFEGLGVPLAGIVGPAVALTEFVGGIALIAGLFTRLAAVGLAGTMLGAITLVHLPAGFFLPNGAEFTLTLLGAVVAVALAGPGQFSLDAVVARRRAQA